jgi:hypothetical protein
MRSGGGMASPKQFNNPEKGYPYPVYRFALSASAKR